MKRVIGVVSAAVASLVVFASTALADYPPSPTVLGTREHNNDGTAFTGANISRGLVLLVVLAVLGVAALFVARRRAAARS